MSSFWIQLGALSGAASVALGAFGAHGLRRLSPDPRTLEIWQTAAHYQLIHSVLLIVSPLIVQSPYNLSGRLLTAGIAIFSGSLYALVLTGEKRLGALTPIGGLALIAGWVALGFRK